MTHYFSETTPRSVSLDARDVQGDTDARCAQHRQAEETEELRIMLGYFWAAFEHSFCARHAQSKAKGGDTTAGANPAGEERLSREERG